MKPRHALIFSLLCGLPVHAADVYTWVDAQGVKHFSSSPPPGQTVEKDELHYNRGDPAAAAAAEQRRQDQEKQAREQSEAAAHAAEEAGTRGAERQRSCADAREIIQRLESSPATRYRREDGTFMRYSPEEVASRLAEARAREQEYCD